MTNVQPRSNGTFDVPIYTIDGAFKSGDTSWKQCTLKWLNDEDTKSLFSRIDTDQNNELSWQEICEYRDSECKKKKRVNRFMYAMTFLNRGSLKQFVQNNSTIREYQNEPDAYRRLHDGTAEAELETVLGNKNLKSPDEIRSKLEQQKTQRAIDTER